MDQPLVRLKIGDEGRVFGSEFCSNINKAGTCFFLLFGRLISKWVFVSSQKEDEIEEYLRRKYAGESAGARHFGDGGEDMSDEITQQTLLPGVKYESWIKSRQHV